MCAAADVSAKAMALRFSDTEIPKDVSDPERAMLLSVHPRFATAILAGTKTVEARRQRVSAPPGTPVLLYATAPMMAIVGMARIASVQVASPREVWSASRTSAGISRREYDEYMSGATQASGLSIEEPITFEEPVSLAALRASGTFHPPQSYRYLTNEDLRRVAVAAPTFGVALQSALNLTQA
ncbi:ASCH domain-containing protein [Streptomyces sp. NPDC094048]|uniref:ASCH domain-containing protein n=1 Tax=Streptomyces sp. NPDC094048 TaxID=3155207 RepID=UPI0033236088